jgi:rhodanese-related sulfurtransferase
VIESVRPSQLADWLAACAQQGGDCPPVVLDVREPWEVQTACVQPNGFELVHMPMRSIPARLNELQRHQPIACLCHHGGRSAQVAYFLKNQGYDNVINIHGGIDAWSQEVDPAVARY